MRAPTLRSLIRSKGLNAKFLAIPRIKDPMYQKPYCIQLVRDERGRTRSARRGTLRVVPGVFGHVSGSLNMRLRTNTRGCGQTYIFLPGNYRGEYILLGANRKMM